MKWVKVPIPIPTEDTVTQISIEGKKLCLIKTQNEVYIIQNICPHAGGVLSGGWCKEGNIICPVHRWEYNLKTGIGAEGQGDYIRVYPIEFREDGFYVGFKQSLWERFFK